MANNYNKVKPGATTGGGSADTLLIVGVGAFTVACFFVGYFFVGKNFTGAGGGQAPATPVETVPGVVSGTTTRPSPKGVLTVVDNTAVMEAKRKKAEEEAKLKAEKEAADKLAQEIKKKAEAEALENSASPSPTASATPDPDDLPASPSPVAPDDDLKPFPPEGVTVASPSASPSPMPKPSPTPKPTPKPSPSPVPATPDDPEDRAMNPPQATTATPPGVLYRVRVGTYDAKQNAEARAAELKASGFETSLSTDVVDGKVVYRLQIAAYRSEKAAREFAKEVEAKGFKTTVSRN